MGQFQPDWVPHAMASLYGLESLGIRVSGSGV